MTPSAKFVKIALANATLPAIYAGGRWGAGEHAVGDGTLPPVFTSLEPPYKGPDVAVGSYTSRTISVELDQHKLPWIREHMNLRIRVTAASTEHGPYEEIGTEISISTARGPTHVTSIADVRLVAMTRSSLSLQWLFAADGGLQHNTSYAAFVAIQICTTPQCAGGSGVGGGFVPNGTADMATALKFQVMDQGHSFSQVYAPFEYRGLDTTSSSFSTNSGAARVGTATVSAAVTPPFPTGKTKDNDDAQ